MASSPPQPPAPPSCSQCTTTVQPATGGNPVQTPSTMTRASDGKMRVDTPTTSVITNPAAGHSIVLNHLTQEAQIIPLAPKPPQGAPGMPQAPGAPAMPGAPAIPAVHVQDLGKSMIDGHPVEGMRYTVQPPGAPQAPGAPGAPAAPAAALPGMPGVPKPPGVPGMPGAPQIPAAGMPGMPGAPKPPSPPGSPQAPGAPSAAMPGLPQPPKPAAVCEVWTSTQFKTPVLTQGSTPSGVQTTKCKPSATAEPDPSLFQVPPGYKVVPPKGA